MENYELVNKYLGTSFLSDRGILWDLVTTDPRIPEHELLNFKNNVVNWNNISYRRLLSWDFIKNNLELLDIYSLSEYQPFIEDPEILGKHKQTLEENCLYQEYIKRGNRDWFIGYININVNDETGDNYIVIKPHLDLDFIFRQVCVIPPKFVKVKVYWKDLKTTMTVKKYEIIRNEVKIL